MPFGLSNLGFIDDTIESVFKGLDDLLTSDEERAKVKKKLKEIQKELKLKTKAHTRRVLEIHAKDRQDARSAQSKSLSKAWWMMPTLAILTFLAFFGILFALVFTDVSIEAKQPLLIMLGTLGTIVTQIAAFLWGSSQGSKEKDEHIREALINMQNRQPQRQSQDIQFNTELEEMPAAELDQVGN